MSGEVRSAAARAWEASWLLFAVLVKTWPSTHGLASAGKYTRERACRLGGLAAWLPDFGGRDVYSAWRRGFENGIGGLSGNIFVDGRRSKSTAAWHGPAAFYFRAEAKSSSHRGNRPNILLKWRKWRCLSSITSPAMAPAGIEMKERKRRAA